VKLVYKNIIVLVIIAFSVLPVKAQNKIVFPRPFAFAVDDLGWNIGNDTGDIDGQGPYRIGINRRMHIKDYKAIVNVGESVGVRIQCLFVLSEMDRLNILKYHPTTTWEGENWNNQKNISPEQIDIMNYVKENAAFMEFGLHGVGHEFWVNGQKKRAEWYCIEDDHPWDKTIMKEHVQCFKDIMNQYGIGSQNGHSFPESFVPTAYGYYWNPDGTYSTGQLMSENGVKYVNTLFDEIRELNPPKEANGGGFDHGVLVVNRINYGNDWYQLDALPTVAIEEQESDIIETHWSNWLAQDDFLQEEVNNKFIAYYNKVQQTPDRYVAKNTEQFYAQWLYKKYTEITEKTTGIVHIDNSKMPDIVYQNNFIGNLVLKIKLEPQQHITEIKLNNQNLYVCEENQGYAFIFLPPLKQKVYQLRYKTGKQTMPIVLDHTGTSNVYNFKVTKHFSEINLKLYGTQTIRITGIKNPDQITIGNPQISLISKEYKPENQSLSLTLKAHDIQGENGKIILH
jgi:hypothetical protein